jgi:hypothetical protein
MGVAWQAEGFPALLQFNLKLTFIIFEEAPVGLPVLFCWKCAAIPLFNPLALPFSAGS